MTTLRFGLKEITIEKICGVFAKHPQVDRAVIYGSRAKGNCHRHAKTIGRKQAVIDWDTSLITAQDLPSEGLFVYSDRIRA